MIDPKEFRLNNVRMRNETKKLIADKTQDGSWIHVRDLRGIIELETDLLQKTCDKRKKIIDRLTDTPKRPKDWTGKRFVILNPDGSVYCSGKFNSQEETHQPTPPEQQP